MASEHVGLAMLAMFGTVVAIAGAAAFLLHRAGWLEPGWSSEYDQSADADSPDLFD